MSISRITREYTANPAFELFDDVYIRQNGVKARVIGIKYNPSAIDFKPVKYFKYTVKTYESGEIVECPAAGLARPKSYAKEKLKEANEAADKWGDILDGG